MASVTRDGLFRPNSADFLNGTSNCFIYSVISINTERKDGIIKLRYRFFAVYLSNFFTYILQLNEKRKFQLFICF